MKTITGREIEIKANEKELTFDITVDGETTYRTNEMTQEEFNENEFNTANDWAQFLKSDDYYKI
jgi:hypothetical protein